MFFPPRRFNFRLSQRWRIKTFDGFSTPFRAGKDGQVPDPRRYGPFNQRLLCGRGGEERDGVSIRMAEGKKLGVMLFWVYTARQRERRKGLSVWGTGKGGMSSIFNHKIREGKKRRGGGPLFSLTDLDRDSFGRRRRTGCSKGTVSLASSFSATPPHTHTHTHPVIVGSKTLFERRRRRRKRARGGGAAQKEI